MSEKAVI
jgi:hypothetical protein